MILDFKSQFWGAHIILVPITLLPARGVCWGVWCRGRWRGWGVGMGILNTVALTGGICRSFEMSTRQRLWCVFFQHGIPHSKGSLQYMWARVRVCLAVPKNVIPHWEGWMCCSSRSLRMMGWIGPAGSLLQVQSESCYMEDGLMNVMIEMQNWWPVQTKWKVRFGQSDAWLSPCHDLLLAECPLRAYDWLQFIGPHVLSDHGRVAFPSLVRCVRTSKCFILEIFPNYVCAAVATNFTPNLAASSSWLRAMYLVSWEKDVSVKKVLGRHDFIIKPKCLCFSRVLPPVAWWLPGCLKALDGRIKGTFSHGVKSTAVQELHCM